MPGNKQGWPAAGRPPLVTARRLFAAAIVAAGLAAAAVLDLTPAKLLPENPGRLALAGEFFSAAASPALTYEAADLPDGVKPFATKVLGAAATTVRYAVAAVSVSLAAGAILGVFASSSWYRFVVPRPGPGRAAGQALYWATRVWIAFTRSVHELIWAVVLLAAFGTVPAVAVVAIAIPYSGTFAKVFSEMLDEAPRRAAELLEAGGATRAQTFVFGLVPQAVPDLIAYALYRFECGLRSAAVMGFLGIPTLGQFIKLSFENIHFHEVWTYLYALGILVVGFDVWSGAVRRRLVSPQLCH